MKNDMAPGTGKLIEFPFGGDIDNGDFSIAKNGKFVSLLEQSRPSLVEGSLLTSRVLHLWPTHTSFSLSMNYKPHPKSQIISNYCTLFPNKSLERVLPNL